MNGPLTNILTNHAKDPNAVDLAIIMAPSPDKPSKVLVPRMLGHSLKPRQAWFPTTLSPRDPAMADPINSFIAIVATTRELMRQAQSACDELQAMLNEEYSGEISNVIQADIASSRNVLRGLEVAFDSHLQLLKPFHQPQPQETT